MTRCFAFELTPSECWRASCGGLLFVVFVVAGFGDQFAQSVLVARFDGDGLLDTTFSGDGYVLTGIGSGGFSRAYALAIQPNGRILLAGQAYRVVAVLTRRRFARRESLAFRYV